MSLHHRTLPSGRRVVEVRWREGNRQRSRNFPDTTAGRKDARAFDRELDRLRRLGELAHELERRRVTVEDLVADWFTRRTDVAPSTMEDYARHFDLRILPAFGTRTAASLQPGDIERWIADMTLAGDGRQTILKAITALSSVLSLAVRDGLIPVNPVAAAKKPRQGRDRLPVLIRPLDVERIRRDLELRGRDRDVVLLDVLAYAGLRPESEAIALRWRHVRERSLLVVDTKRNVERSVPMVDPLRESLARWRMRTGRPGLDQLVFPTEAGLPWTRDDWRNWLRRTFRPSLWWATDLPYDTRPRDLRGSFVSLLVHEGKSIVEVARQLGHAPEVCLRDYAQVFDDTDPRDRRPAAEIILASRARVRTQFARFQAPDLSTTRKAA